MLCGAGPKGVNAHHIEDYRLNKRLRYDPDNGISVCPRCHKFGLTSVHRSGVTIAVYLTEVIPKRFLYLRKVRLEIWEENEDNLKKIIAILEEMN